MVLLYLGVPLMEIMMVKLVEDSPAKIINKYKNFNQANFIQFLFTYLSGLFM